MGVALMFHISVGTTCSRKTDLPSSSLEFSGKHVANDCSLIHIVQCWPECGGGGVPCLVVLIGRVDVLAVVMCAVRHLPHM